MASMGSSHHGGDDDGRDPPLPCRLTLGHEEDAPVEETSDCPEGRGRATLKAQEKAKEKYGGKIPVMFCRDDDTFNPIGETSHHLPQVIGNFTTLHLPQDYIEFESIPIELREALWPRLEYFFDVDAWRADPDWKRIEAQIWRYARTRYNDNKGKAKKALFDNKKQRPQVPVEEWEVPVEEWERLQKLWMEDPMEDPRHLKRSKASKELRKKQGALEGQGSRSFTHRMMKDASAPEQGSTTTPHVLPLSGVYDKMGQRKDDTWRDSRFETTHQVVTEMMQTGTPFPVLSEKEPIGLLTQVMGRASGFAMPNKVVAQPDRLDELFRGMVRDYNRLMEQLCRPTFDHPALPSSTLDSTAASGAFTSAPPKGPGNGDDDDTPGDDITRLQ